MESAHTPSSTGIEQRETDAIASVDQRCGTDWIATDGVLIRTYDHRSAGSVVARPYHAKMLRPFPKKLIKLPGPSSRDRPYGLPDRRPTPTPGLMRHPRPTAHGPRPPISRGDSIHGSRRAERTSPPACSKGAAAASPECQKLQSRTVGVIMGNAHDHIPTIPSPNDRILMNTIVLRSP